jgi:aminoethylphosphonate catabolism LysR family transcriptional regulator
MTPTQARAFLAVAIEGSFTGAAKRLNLSQPSVTTQVGLLERQYKVELFHRIGRGVRLTPAGTALLPMVRRLFTSLDEAAAYLRHLHGQRQGYLRVGSYTPHRFIGVVARYKRRFPGVSIWVEFANSRVLARKVLNYELDLAVTAREYALPSFYSLAFTSDSLIVLAPKGSAWERRRSISVEELKREIVVCREPGSSSRSAADRLIDTAGMPASQVVEIGSREGVIAAVAEGMGLGVIFDDEFLAEARVVKVPIRGPVTSSHDDLVCMSERRNSQIISGFLAITQEYIDERRRPIAARQKGAESPAKTTAAVAEEAGAVEALTIGLNHRCAARAR